jgi:hypothetical protein
MFSIRRVVNRVFLLCLPLIFLTACSTQTLYTNTNTRLGAIADDEFFLLLPTDIHGLSGNRKEKETVFYQSFLDAFGSRALKTEHLKDQLYRAGLADISWRMSHAMHHLVTAHGYFNYAAEQGAHDGNKFTQLDREIAHLTQWVTRHYGLTVPPRYIGVAHIDSMGVAEAGEHIQYRVIAGIYSTERQTLERVVSYVKKSSNQNLAILHDLDILGVLLYRELFEL